MPRGGRREGQGRPNELGESKQVAVRLPLELVEKITHAATTHKTTVANMIRVTLEKHFA